MSEQEFLPLEVSIPNEAGWPKKTLDELCNLISRGTAPVYVEGSSVLAIGQRCVTTSRFAPEFARPHADRAMRNVLRPESGDVLLNSTGTGTIGRSVVFDHDGAFIVDGHVTVLRPRAEAADGRWLNAVLRTSWGQSHLERFCYAGSTNQLELIRKPVKASVLPVPTVQEQQGIAQILDIFDTAIRETEALIDKLKAIKQSLLHDLLTRGIDSNGQLRPPESEAPQLYKESPLGWIPREWDAQLIATLLTDIEAGKSPSCSDTPAPSGSWGVLKVSAVHSDGFRSDQNKLVEHESLVNPAYEVHSGDLLITRANTPELVGMACLVEDPQPKLMLCDKTLRLVVNCGMASKEYLCLCLQQPYIRSQIECSATGTSMSMKNISQHAIRNLLVAIAPLPEQIEISARANTLALRLQHEMALLEKLRQQKAGLMDDLLTGRVRVTPLLESVQQAAPSMEA
ncbi:restriction endonuclease subunit S [Pseudomonas citri]|uniref:restriction endonuclease subunit S n=1 Tax=Pseudomonas citri TaxID=2978349 RepID=UPI0021B64567|nr:restriction endonuclease subunit S [Pseudomonas citri]